MSATKLTTITHCVLLFFASVVFAQNNVTQDAQAVSLMNACIAASGGAQIISAVQDFTGSGTATFNWDQPTQAPSTVKGRVANQFRVDSTVGGTTRSWAVLNGSGILADIDDSRTVLNQQTAYSLRNMSLPVLDFLAALSDQYASISYVGLVSSDQGQAHQIHIQEQYPPSMDPTGSLSAALSRDYFVDPSSYLIVETKDNQSAGVASTLYSHSVLFSGFTAVNGITAPLSITEVVNGQQTWTLQLTTITFNVGLTDIDFQL